jgi:hypothetical protein
MDRLTNMEAFARMVELEIERRALIAQLNAVFENR